MRLNTREIILLCTLTMMPGGCALMQHNAPDRQMQYDEMLSSVSTVAVLEPGMNVSHTGLNLYDRQMLVSIEAGALAGTDAGLQLSGGQGDVMIFLVPLGLVLGAIGGVIIPTDVPVEPSIQQLQTSQAVLTRLMEASLAEHKELQAALISEGNKIPARLFVALGMTGRGDLQGRVENSPSARSIDAILRVENLDIVLTGLDADNPLLALRVSIKIILTNADSPLRCLGWRESTWEGKSRLLSEWTANEGEHLKAGLASAIDAFAHEAITSLFVPKHELVPFYKKKATAPSWSECFPGDPDHRLTDVKTYCPLADQGFAGFQSRIGDVFYNESHKSRRNLIRAYVWYGLAARGNDELASDRIAMLTRMLTPDELKEARQRLHEWKAGQCVNDLSDAFMAQSQ
jgi:hypothetical protein